MSPWPRVASDNDPPPAQRIPRWSWLIVQSAGAAAVVVAMRHEAKAPAVIIAAMIGRRVARPRGRGRDEEFVEAILRHVHMWEVIIA